MSDFRRNLGGIRDALTTPLIPRNMGTVDLGDYPYGDHRARTRPISLEQPVSKSWLFEIVDRETFAVSESFTLVLPPQSYTIREPQRVSITKTFGNAFVDDYGSDNIEITLKGISGTAHVFPTFSRSGTQDEFPDLSLVNREAERASQGYTGRDAFYYFRDRIMRYKDNIEGWENKELRVYDLADEQAYKCVLLDFTLDRTSEHPLHYPFSISLFVYADLDSYKPGLKGINISEDPLEALESVETLMDKLDNLYRGLQTIVNASAAVRGRVQELRTRWNRALSQISRVLVSPLEIAGNLVDSVSSLMQVGYDAYRAGQMTFDRWTGFSELVRDSLNNGLRVYGYQISEGWQRVQTISFDEDRGVNPLGGATGLGATGSAAAEVSRDSEVNTFTASGIKTTTVGGQDTLQSLARRELGDEELWPFIAAVNPNITSSDDLVSGQTIIIPVETDPTDNTRREQFIFSENQARDPYGADIRLNDNGDIMFESNDVALIAGVPNVRQAINLRLNTEAGSLIKQSAFGITAQAGSAGSNMALRYLRMSIRSTIIQDPRVSSVDNLQINLRGDVVQISMNIRLVGSDTTLPIPLEL